MSNYETVIDLMNDRERMKQQRDELAKALADVLDKHGGLGVSPEIVRARAVMNAVLISPANT